MQKVKRRASDAEGDESHLLREDVPNGNAPWWAKMGYRVLNVYGPIAIVCIAFLGMWAGWIPSPITQNQVILLRVEGKLDAAIREMAKEVSLSHDKDESMLRIMLATCINVAKNELQVKNCQDYWRR